MGKEGNIFIAFTIIICTIIGLILFYYLFTATEASSALFGDEIGKTFAFIGLFLLLLGIVLSVVWLVNKTRI